MASQRRKKGEETAEELGAELGEEDPKTPVPQAPERRAIAAAKLKISGASDAEIAQLMDYASPAAARMAWEDAIASTVDPETDFQSLRRLRAAQLEAGLKALAPKALSDTIMVNEEQRDGTTKRVRRANTEHIAYSQQFLRYLDRLIRLQGLDAPQVTMLVTPGVQEFEAIVGQLIQSTRKDQAKEADIFDDEIEGEFEEDADA